MHPGSLTRYFLSAVLALTAVAGVGRGTNQKGKELAKDGPGFFFPVADAKDCAFDQVRGRLYVTTPKKLVVVDIKNRKVIESVDLPGGLQGCDIAPDFSFLAVAPISAQYVYRVGLKWDKIADMEVSQIKFKAGSSESGVHGVCVGSDGTILFSTTFAGSGGVTLRRVTREDKVEEVGPVNMDSVLIAGGGRDFAAVAQGNISSGPLGVYDFKEKKLKSVADLGNFNYEIACSRGANFYARPTRKGCELFDGKGGRLGTLDGNPVIAAAFHPKTDSLFVMRHGEVNIQEYDIQGKNVSNAYPLDKPLVIRGDVRETVTLQPVGRDVVMASFRVNVTFNTYASGRLKIAENGETLFAVTPKGVYVFPIKATPAPADNKPRPKIKVIDPEPVGVAKKAGGAAPIKTVFKKPGASKTPTSYLKMISEPGDFIGQGKKYDLKGDDLKTRVTERGVGVGVDGWSLDFGAPEMQFLKVGEYQNAKRYHFSGDSPGLEIFGDGRAGSKVAGAFVVWELEVKGEKVIKLAIDFVQRSDGEPQALTGKLRFNSTLE